MLQSTGLQRVRQDRVTELKLNSSQFIQVILSDILAFTISQSQLKFMSIELVMLSNQLMLCHPLLFLPSIFLRIRVFCNESPLPIRWPKYWSFNFSLSPFNEYSGFISFRIDWFDLLSPRNSQESSLTPQFKCISSSMLSLLYDPALTFIHDY